MRKVSSLSDVQLVLNDLNNKLETLSTKAQNLNGRQIKNAGNATDPQDFVTLAQLKAINLTNISGTLQKHQITSVDASVISGNLNFNTGIFNTLSTHSITISGQLTLSPGVGIVMNNANLNLINSSIECNGFITIAAPNGLVLTPTFDVGNACLRVLYPSYGAGSGIPIPFPNPYGVLLVSGLNFPKGYGLIVCDALTVDGGVSGSAISQFNAGLFIAGNGAGQLLNFGNTFPQSGIRWNSPNLQWSDDNTNFINFPTNKLYAEFTGTTQTITAGAGFTAVTSCSVTLNATGTWLIMGNAFVQQAAAAGDTCSIRFARNGSGDTHTAGSGAPAAGEYMLHFNVSISLTSGDVIALQASAVGANASLLGTGDTGTTNITAIFLGP